MTVVLVAEDDRAQLQGLSAILRYAGFQVHAAGDGQEAIAVGTRVRPDAAICDWNLGEGPDGADVVRQLRNVRPDLVPIFITGNDVASLRAQTLTLHDARYFAKPVSPDRLVEALRVALGDPSFDGRGPSGA